MNPLKPDSCSFCKGKLHDGETEFMARVGEQVAVITEVPAWICDNCGEAYYSAETSQKIDAVMEKVHQGVFIGRPLTAGEIKLS